MLMEESVKIANIKRHQKPLHHRPVCVLSGCWKTTAGPICFVAARSKPQRTGGTPRFIACLRRAIGLLATFFNSLLSL